MHAHAHANAGKGCSVGHNSVVLYSSAMEDGSVLDSCSLAMKGEVLMKAVKYEGIPAVACASASSGSGSSSSSGVKYQPPHLVV